MTSERDIVQAGLGALPVFPLPGGVLLPYELVPFHVFEPRYVDMFEDVLARSRPVGVARLAAGWEGDYEGRPALEPLLGVGLVVRSERLPDGRFNVLLKGVLRAELIRELPGGQAFREFQAVPRLDAPSDLALAQSRAESLKRMLFGLCAGRPGAASSALAQLAAQAAGPGELADIVAAALFTDYETRVRALESEDPALRLELAQIAVAELLVGLEDNDPDGPRLVN